MQRQRFFDSIEKTIKEYFYNTLVIHILESGEYDQHSIEQKVRDATLALLQNLVTNSIGKEGIVLPDIDLKITADNCPNTYRPLLSCLLRLKESANLNAYQQAVLQITSMDSFRAINPAQQLLEMAGLVAPAPSDVHYDETNVSTDLIRQTFYEEMVAQALLAVESGWLSKADLEEQEPGIYLTLPALTILEAIQQSQHCAGIRLLNNKAVTVENCPQTENFPLLVKSILEAKNKIKRLSNDECRVVKHCIASDQPLSPQDAALKTSALMQTVAIIKGMAIEITKRNVFQQTVNHVIEHYLEMQDDEKAEKPMRPQ